MRVVVYLPEPNAFIKWLKQGQTLDVAEELWEWLANLELQGQTPESFKEDPELGTLFAEGPNGELVEFELWPIEDEPAPITIVEVLSIYALPSAPKTTPL